VTTNIPSIKKEKVEEPKSQKTEKQEEIKAGKK
jgi:hypothetical protein